jgi:putative spermidine/putrescine transport system permease protein
MSDFGGRRSIWRWCLLAAGPLFAYGVIFIFPMLQLVRSSFDQFDPLKGSVSAFDMAFYVKFVSDPFYLGVMWRTIRISLVITLICAVAGYPISYYLARSTGRLRQLLIVFLLVPLVTSPVVVAYGWLILLGSKGIINNTLISLSIVNEPIKLIYTELTLIVGLVHVLAPFMILAIAASLQNLDWNLVLAARSLGAGGVSAFLRIILPLSLPGIASGSLIVFSLAMSAYAVPVLIAGPQIKVMSELIYEQGMALLNWPFAAAMSVLLLLVTTGVLVTAEALRLGRSRPASSAERGA